MNRPLIPACEYCNVGLPHTHTEDALRAEIVRLHEVAKRQSERHRETVDRWVKTADEEREKKDAALLQKSALEADVMRLCTAIGPYCDVESSIRFVNNTNRLNGALRELLEHEVRGSHPCASDCVPGGVAYCTGCDDRYKAVYKVLEQKEKR